MYHLSLFSFSCAWTLDLRSNTHTHTHTLTIHTHTHSPHPHTPHHTTHTHTLTPTHTHNTHTQQAHTRARTHAYTHTHTHTRLTININALWFRLADDFCAGSYISGKAIGCYYPKDSYLAFERPGIGTHVFIMYLQGVVFFALVILLDGRYLVFWYNRR